MSADEDVHKLEHQLDEERHELWDTVDQIERKISRTREWLHPAHFIQRHPFVLLSGAVYLGFLVGTHLRLERLVWDGGN
jgi:hypothetical protein